MAYSKSSLLDKTSGRIGNTILYNRNGEIYARSKPVKVTNPQTDLQQANRMNIAFIVEAFRQLRPLLIISLNSRPANRYAYHEFLSLNLNHSIINGEFYPENLKLSTPIIRSSDFIINRLVEDSNKFRLSWESIPSGNQLSTDKLYAAIYSPEINQFDYIISGVYRNTGNATLEFNPIFKNVACLVYLFFVRSDITYASPNSVHAFDAIR